MKKAIIPLGIAAVFCLVGSVVYFSNVSYPSKLEFEGAGGTDETVESLDDAEAVLSIPAFQRGGSYYAALSALEEDPEPAEEGNSVGVEVTGYYNQNGFSENRTLLVAQNEKGLIYQYNGTQTSDGTAVTRNMFMAASKYGMFIKFNSISTVQTSTSDSSETQQYDEMTSTYEKASMDAIKSHCGKWYSTEITEAHAEEIERLSQSMNEDDMIRAYAYGICASVSTTYLQQFMQTVDSNNQVMAQLQSMVSANKDSAEQVSNHVYEFKHQSFDVQLNLSNKTTPVFDLKGSSQRQKITLHHINNEKVEIVEKADGGDFIDLFGEAIYNAMKSAAESEM